MHSEVSWKNGAIWLTATAALLIALMTACTRVNSGPDFRQADDLLRKHTQADQAYDPDADAVIEERVHELLKDGVSFDEAVQVALLNNRGFQALFSTIGASRADVVQSSLLSNPSMGFSARFPEGGGRSDLTINFAQELVDLWQIPVRRRIAEAQLEATVLDVARRGIELATDVHRNYYQLESLERAEKIAKENLEIVEQSIRLTEVRVKAGEAREIDVNLLRANELDVQASLLAISRDRDVARADLGKLLGLARWEQPWEIKNAIEPTVTTISDDRTLIVFAMQERLETSIAGAKVRAADGELRRQYLNVFSHVSLGIDGERKELRAFPGRKILADTARASVRQGKLTAPDIQTRGERNIAKRQIIDSIVGPSVQITLPIWDQNQAQIAKANSRVDQTRKEYEDLLDEVARQVQRTTAVVRASAALIQFYEKRGVPVAQENLELVRKAYESGEQSIVAVYEAQKILIALRLAAVNVRRDYLVAMVELQGALGGRGPPSTTTAPAATQPVESGDDR